MKKVILILLFILILTRILQQLQIRAKEQQSNPSEVLGDNLVQIGSSTQEKSQPSLNQQELSTVVSFTQTCSEGFASYSDINKQKNTHITSTSISRTEGRFDKAIFLGKGLIDKLKCFFSYISNLLNVWKSLFQRWRLDVLRLGSSAFSSVFYSSVSNIVTGLILGKDAFVQESKAWSLSTATYSQSYVNHFFKVTGTQHLLAISGFHLSFFIAFVAHLYGKFFSKARANLLHILFAGLYVLTIGISPGLVRAFLMFCMSCVAFHYKRQKRGLYSIFVVFIIAIYIDISTLFTVGFQLSYLATLGIILLSTTFPKFSSLAEYFVTNQSNSFQFPQVATSFFTYFYDSLMISLAAQIAVTPLLAYYFQELSIVGIFATTAIGWLVPFILRFGMWFLLARFLLPATVLHIFSLPLFLATELLFKIIVFLSFPWAVVSFAAPSLFATVCMYGVLFACFVAFKQIRKHITTKKHEKIYHFCIFN